LARYRLRFVLQEVDLPRGVTVIGRSLDCHVTIEDALVSRRHAQLVVAENGVQIEDLGSRNGVKVNGSTIVGATPLRSGDRLRIGTQELLLTRVEEASRAQARTTGQLRFCANCRQPYPREMVACPTCEATEQTEDDTVTAVGGSPGESHRWTVQLFVEAVERALRLGRVPDAERLVRRATGQVEELVAAGRKVDDDVLAALATQAAATTLAGNDPTWALWAVEIFGVSERIPPLGVVDKLVEVAVRYPEPVCAAVGKLLQRLEPVARIASGPELVALARLRQF
jgi:hypothetical protein